MRSKAANAIENLPGQCEAKLGALWDLTDGTDSLLYKVNAANPNGDQFFDGGASSVSSRTLGSFGWSGPNSGNTVGQLFSSIPDLGGFTSQNDGHAGNQIVLSPGFGDLNSAVQNALLVHEVLHTYTGMNDTDLASTLGLGQNLSTAAASGPITEYLKHGCLGIS